MRSSLLASSSHQALIMTSAAKIKSGLMGVCVGDYYGLENIPLEWIEQIARQEDMMNLATRLAASVYNLL